MQCDVFNVAPVKKLSVRWYKGNTKVITQTFDNLTVYPVNTSSVITLHADRDDHGSLIWCEAAMTWLGSDRHANRSQAYKMEVLCMFLMPSYLSYTVLSCLFYLSCDIWRIPHLSSVPPTFPNATDEELKLRDRSPLLLNCTASGNPAPAYSWRFPDPIQVTFMNETANRPVLMPVLQLPGVYTCMVWNSQGKTTKAFTVIEPESKTFTLNPASFPLYIYSYSICIFCVHHSIIPSCCCFQQVATVGPLLLFYWPCFSLYSLFWPVVFIRNSIEPLIRPQGLNKWAETGNITRTPISRRGPYHLCSHSGRIRGCGGLAHPRRPLFRYTRRYVCFQQRQLSERTAYFLRTCMRLTVLKINSTWRCLF